MNLITIGIIGGAGYTGGELLRILLHHPNAHISFIHSTSNAGKPVTSVHADLLGETHLHFAAEISYNVDVLFLCVGHGEAKKFLAANQIPRHVRVIDLSQDFRYANSTDEWVYGLPELHKDRITSAQSEQANIANPGCFATCIQLALLPWAKTDLLPEEVHITGITGSTGAGQALSQTSHFSWRSSNLSVYKAFEHQHLREIRASLRILQPNFDETKNIHFVPMRGNFTRGILASVYGKCPESANFMHSAYRDYYQNHPFVHVAETEPDVKQVVNTNKCVLSVQKHGEMLHIVSVIDNLLKGASGQAVQNMNLLFGFPETAGLNLKAVAL
ncbi:MAG: N-acetyl-gamma-glutamyl-phosphate reductase [Candidatus Kapabacteria bacterium]|jgi:N-acetyl-gamma-glutamyl-phosphate reductase|nr:N-acetyl-gamma-glutamyl-phosphate reductase [Candidatus Kapabacteria bacterium]